MRSCKTDDCTLPFLANPDITTNNGFTVFVASGPNTPDSLVLFYRERYNSKGEVCDSVPFVNEHSPTIFPELDVLVDNAFTPNGDGNNDMFSPIVDGKAYKYSLLIFNRWGEVVFRSDLPGQGWDGSSEGQPQPVGTYSFSIQIECFANRASRIYRTQKSGVVSLIR